MAKETIDYFSSQAGFRQLAELLLERRRNHERALPPFRELCREYGVSLGVIQRAIQLLCSRGYLTVRQNVGCQWVEGAALPPAVRKIGFIHAYAPDRDRFLEDSWALGQAFSELGVNGFGVFRWSGGVPSGERTQVDELRRLNLDGLIVSPCSGSESSFFEELALEMPVMAIDTPFPGSNLPAVMHDYRGCGAQIASALRKAGRKKLLILQNSIGNQSTEEIAEALRLGIDAEQLCLPLLSASDAAEKGKFAAIRRIGRIVSRRISDGGCDAVFCPYHETINRLYSEYLGEKARDLAIPVLIGINRPFWYSEQLIGGGAMIWERCPDAVMKLALQRLLSWRVGHQRTTGIKRVKLCRRR